MNELDDRLWAKFHMFEEIDRAVQGNNDDLSQENRPRAQEDKFDRLYRQGRSSRSPPSRGNVSYTTKDSEDTLRMRKPISRNRLSKSPSRQVNPGSRPTSKTSTRRDNNNVGERLYNLAVNKTKRLEEKRKTLERSRQKSPKITRKAREIIRDPNAFQDRLYPRNLSKCTSEDSFDVKVKSIYKRERKKSYEKFDFKPHLNQKSLKMATKLDRSIERKSPVKQNTRSIYKRKVSPSPSSRLNEMYQKGKTKYNERAKKKEVLDSERKKKEVVGCSFKPEINRLRSRSRSLTPEKFYQKEINWKKKVEKKTSLQREYITNDRNRELRFKPQISSPVVNDDEEIISKNIEKMNEYASKRRAFLEKQANEKERIRKKFNPGENFTIKRTIPKEFRFNSRSRSKSKKTFERADGDSDDEFASAVAKLHNNIAKMKI